VVLIVTLSIALAVLMVLDQVTEAAPVLDQEFDPYRPMDHFSSNIGAHNHSEFAQTFRVEYYNGEYVFR
jgi:hypothetical protein